MVGAEVGLRAGVVAVEARVDLRRDHRLARPASEELVAALAVEDGGETGLARRPSQEILRPGHGIAEGEVELPREVVQHGTDVLAADGDEGERYLEVIGDDLGLALLDAALAEVEAQGLHGDAGLAEPHGHSRGVDAAGEIETDLALPVEPPGDRVAEEPTDLGHGGRLLLQRGVDRFPEREVRPDLQAPALPRRHPTGKQAPHTLDRDVLSGDEGEGQVLVERHRIGADGEVGNGEELLQLAGEVEHAAMLRVVEGADAEGIADQEEPPPLAVPPRAREGAVEGVEAVGPGDQAFAQSGRRRRHRRRERSRAGHQVRTVAVDPRRLPGTARPPAVAEGHAGTEGGVGPVAAVVDGRQHGVERGGIGVANPAAEAAQRFRSAGPGEGPPLPRPEGGDAPLVLPRPPAPPPVLGSRSPAGRACAFFIASHRPAPSLTMPSPRQARCAADGRRGSRTLSSRGRPHHAGWGGGCQSTLTTIVGVAGLAAGVSRRTQTPRLWPRRPPPPEPAVADPEGAGALRRSRYGRCWRNTARVRRQASSAAALL